tara:strand:- start:100 stop:309 length:210 start_codon:yes stop_codon:yes gene_type:complete
VRGNSGKLFENTALYTFLVPMKYDAARQGTPSQVLGPAVAAYGSSVPPDLGQFVLATKVPSRRMYSLWA